MLALFNRSVGTPLKLLASIVGLAIAPVSTFALDFTKAGDRLALEFLNGETHDEEALNKFQTEHVPGAKFQTAFQKSVKAGLQLKDGGVNHSYSNFNTMLVQLRTNPKEKIDHLLNAESVTLFLAFRTADPFDPDSWEDFLAKNNAKSDAFKTAFKRVQTVAMALEEEEIPHTSPYYTGLIQDNVAMPKGLARNATSGGKKSSKPTNNALVELKKQNQKNRETNQATTELWREGVALYQGMTRAQQELLPENNAVVPLDLVNATGKPKPQIPDPIPTVINDDEGTPVTETKVLTATLTAADELLMGLALKERKFKRLQANKAQEKAKTAEESVAPSDDNKAVAEKEVRVAKLKQEATEADAEAETETSAPDEAVARAEQLARLNVIEAAPFGNKRDGIIRFFQFGVRKLSPYSVTPAIENPGTDTEKTIGLMLEPAKSDTTSFLEFIYSNRWAWNLERLSLTDDPRDHTDTHSLSMFNRAQRSQFNETNPNLGFGDNLDFDIRFSYNLEDTAGTTATTTGEMAMGDATQDANNEDLSAGGIAGGSDISIGINLGWHMFRHRFANGAAYAVTLDAGYEMSSSRKNFDAHHRLFLGPGYSANFDVPGSHGRPALFSARVGWSRLDNFVYSKEPNAAFPRLLDLDRGVPSFEMDDSVSLETELIYPFGRDSLITMSGRIYGKTDPNLWFVQIAYSRPINAFLGGLFEIGDDDKDAPLKNPAERRTTTGE